jgi:hypothetical protein
MWSTIRGYFWWTYPRGSVHYDVMVTLILAFVFLAPLKFNFKDKPQEKPVHPIRVIVTSDPAGGFIYGVEAAAVHGANDAEIRESLEGIIEPIAGDVDITRWEPVRDNKGHVNEYRVWVAARP